MCLELDTEYRLLVLIVRTRYDSFHFFGHQHAHHEHVRYDRYDVKNMVPLPGIACQLFVICSHESLRGFCSDQIHDVSWHMAIVLKSWLQVIFYHHIERRKERKGRVALIPIKEHLF